MSWCGRNFFFLEEVINNLLSLGVVLVGALANTTMVDYCLCSQSSLGQNFIVNPASYNFPDFGYQVIAVTDTQLTDQDGSLDVPVA